RNRCTIDGAHQAVDDLQPVGTVVAGFTVLRELAASTLEVAGGGGTLISLCSQVSSLPASPRPGARRDRLVSERSQELHTTTEPTCAVDARRALFVLGYPEPVSFSNPLHSQPAQFSGHFSMQVSGILIRSLVRSANGRKAKRRPELLIRL